MFRLYSDFDRIFGWPDVRRSWSALDRFSRQMDRLVRDWNDPALGQLAGGFPHTNLYDMGEELVVTAEVPGMTADDIDVSLHNNLLSLSGSRQVDLPEGYSVHRRERSPIQFKRSFSLPCRVDVENTKAEVKDGILTIHMTKTPESKPRQISVQTN